MIAAMSSGFGVAPNTPYWLVAEGKSFPLAPGSYVIGRSVEVEISFPRDSMMSRRHARLSVTAAGVEIEDLGSSNGTWIGAELIQHSVTLREGTELRIGSQSFVLRRMHTARRRERATTSPDLPTYRAPASQRDDASEPDPTTHQGSPVDMVYADAVAALDAGATDQARKMVEPLLDLLAKSEPRVGPRAIARASVLALRLAVATRHGPFADWVLTHHRMHRAVLDPQCLELFELALSSRVRLDAGVVREYLTELRAVSEQMTDGERASHERLELALRQ